MLFLVMVAVLALFAFGFEGRHSPGRHSPGRPEPGRQAAVPGRDLRSDGRTAHSYILPGDRR
jgi:hypothetical protein